MKAGEPLPQPSEEDSEEFRRAIDDYKRVCRRPFLGWSEVLAIALRLGYVRAAAANLNESKGDKPAVPPRRVNPLVKYRRKRPG